MNNNLLSRLLRLLALVCRLLLAVFQHRTAAGDGEKENNDGRESS